MLDSLDLVLCIGLDERYLEPGVVEQSLAVGILSLGQTIAHLVDQDFKTPFIKLEIVSKFELKPVLLWNWLVLDCMRMNIVIVVLANVRELEIRDVVVQSDAKDSIVGHKLPDL